MVCYMVCYMVCKVIQLSLYGMSDYICLRFYSKIHINNVVKQLELKITLVGWVEFKAHLRSYKL